MNTINITIHAIHINTTNGAEQADPLLSLMQFLSSHADQDGDTPDMDDPVPAQGYIWPEAGRFISDFESAKNYFNDDADGPSALPEVIEVTEDYFRVKGEFTSKTGKGTRMVTLKVSRDEVASGVVTYLIADF